MVTFILLLQQLLSGVCAMMTFKIKQKYFIAQTAEVDIRSECTLLDVKLYNHVYLGFL